MTISRTIRLKKREFLRQLNENVGFLNFPTTLKQDASF